MIVSLNQWCGVSMVTLIAEYHSPSKFKIHPISLTGSFVYFFTVSLLNCVYISLLTLLYTFSFLACSGDIEANPDLKNSSKILTESAIGTLIFLFHFFT